MRGAHIWHGWARSTEEKGAQEETSLGQAPKLEVPAFFEGDLALRLCCAWLMEGPGLLPPLLCTHSSLGKGKELRFIFPLPLQGGLSPNAPGGAGRGTGEDSRPGWGHLRLPWAGLSLSGDASAILVKAQAKAEAIGLLSMALTQQVIKGRKKGLAASGAAPSLRLQGGSKRNFGGGRLLGASPGS